MGKKVTAYTVTSIASVNKTLYVEGDIFIGPKSVGILVNGNIKTFGNAPQSLKDYSKTTEVQKMIDDAIDAIGTGGE